DLETRFVLLTNEATHDELRYLDCDNIQRVIVRKASKPNSAPAPQKHSIKALLPAPLRRRWAQLRYKLVSLAARQRNARMLSAFKVDLLFCPFTAPTFYAPGVLTVCTFYDLQFVTYPQFF